jgi:hypothetical protein
MMQAMVAWRVVSAGSSARGAGALGGAMSTRPASANRVRSAAFAGSGCGCGASACGAGRLVIVWTSPLVRASRISFMMRYLGG